MPAEAAFNLSQAALHAMLAQPYRDGARSRGRIVTVTATASKAPNPGMSTFSTMKAAVNILMLAIAREHKGDGIVANALLIGGGVEFPGNDYLRSAEDRATAVQPEEIADALTFLASDRASGINGVIVDLTARRIA